EDAAGSFERDHFWGALSKEADGTGRDGTGVGTRPAQPTRCLSWAQWSLQPCPFPPGTTLRKAVRDAALDVAEGMLQLTEALTEPRPRVPLARSSTQERLVCTGSVWEACERVAALPRDNQAAVALALSSCLGVVRDALEEMEQAQVEGGDPYGDVLEDEDLGSRGNQDVYWTEADRQLLGPCTGLVKAAKACLKKVGTAVRAHAKAETAEQVAQLDDLMDIARDVSPSVDELVLSTYPPVNQLTLRDDSALVLKALSPRRASHACPASEESWLGFLEGAVEHNMDKIKGHTQALL
uniref:Cyclin D1 binding protein 1 n=1 Tax=Salvator merianae TaxID=96440 RepID=A0A8D0E3W8_SALMN